MIASVAARSDCRTIPPPKFDSWGFVTRTTLVTRPAMPEKDELCQIHVRRHKKGLRHRNPCGIIQLAFQKDSYAQVVPDASTEQGLVIHNLNAQGCSVRDTTTDDGM